MKVLNLKDFFEVQDRVFQKALEVQDRLSCSFQEIQKSLGAPARQVEESWRPLKAVLEAQDRQARLLKELSGLSSLS